MLSQVSINGHVSRFIVEFHKDMEALRCLPPALEPKATDHVPDMVRTIEQIISNGHGYAVGGDVFFDTVSLEGYYGRLSQRKQVSCTLLSPILHCVCAWGFMRPSLSQIKAKDLKSQCMHGDMCAHDIHMSGECGTTSSTSTPVQNAFLVTVGRQV